MEKLKLKDKKMKYNLLKFRTFNEEMTTADVRGLGYVSGAPAGSISNYASDNIASADTMNDVLKKFINVWHNNLHNRKTK